MTQIDVANIEDILPRGLDPVMRKFLILHKDAFEISHQPFADHLLYVTARLKRSLPGEVRTDPTLLRMDLNFRFRVTLDQVAIELTDYDNTRSNWAFWTVSEHKDAFQYVTFQPTRLSFEAKRFAEFFRTLSRLGFSLKN